MGLLQTLFIVAVLAVVVYVIYTFFIKKLKLLSNVQIRDKIINNSSKEITWKYNITNNYAYSIWFYVSDWQHRLGQDPKDTSSFEEEPMVHRILEITLAPYENNILISVDTYPTNGSQPSQSPTCSINNFPLQRWVNLTISLNNRTLDTYLNGKLVRTCILPNTS